MHARRIIQDFLSQECPSIHAKRSACLALVTGAAQQSGLGLLRLSRRIDSQTSLRHRIKRCDRLLSNPHLADERIQIYRALSQRILGGRRHIAIIVDWSDLLSDISQHVLRATVVVEGRSIVVYEEIHPTKSYNVASVHRKFMMTLRDVLPACCEPIIITDAGFRSTWFSMLNELDFAWIGRVRNRDMMRQAGHSDWLGCQQLYAGASKKPRDLGTVAYVRRSPIECRAVLVKEAKKGRKSTTVFGRKKQSAHSKKQARTQREPWLLAVSLQLANLSAAAIVGWYALRMQIEQTFRDLKNAQWGMGLRNSQTRKPGRLAALLLIAALLSFALWLIGLAAIRAGYQISYGSRAKAANSASILTLARHWLDEHRQPLLKHQLDQALVELRGMVKTYGI